MEKIPLIGIFVNSPLKAHLRGSLKYRPLNQGGLLVLAYRTFIKNNLAAILGQLTLVIWVEEDKIREYYTKCEESYQIFTSIIGMKPYFIRSTRNPLGIITAVGM
jgi:hypothetical protein